MTSCIAGGKAQKIITPPSKATKRRGVELLTFTRDDRYTWPDEHLRYMRVRMDDHGATFFSLFIRGFAHARGNIENPGCESSPPSTQVMDADLHSLLLPLPAICTLVLGLG